MVRLVDGDVGRQSVLKWIDKRQEVREKNRLEQEKFNDSLNTDKDGTSKSKSIMAAII